MGTGEFRNIREACRKAITVTRTIKPDARRKAMYKKHYAEFARLYPALRAEFAKIAEL